MARTDAGAELTERFRRAQLQLRARALRDFITLWPIWTGDWQSFQRLMAATGPLVRVYRGVSSSTAIAYYEAFRGAEKIAGPATPRLAGELTPARLAKSMYVTGQVMTRDAITAGQPPAEARKTALIRVSGAVTRQILSGARESILESVAADREARGWARVTDGAPCAFCAMLAGRGPVYKSETTAEFQAHDHCACVAEPMYPDSTWPGRSREFNDLYKQAVRDATAAGELDRGTSNDLLNAFRRAYDARRATTTA